ncbi:MAG: SDR family oxidoreductase [Thermoanaerobaculia bacterium]|nr:SDR family oxidoreductase [Thermoanaerobaculia bacterium]
MTEFKDKAAIVTGASSGIGRRTAELLVERGARVAIFARSADKLAAIAAPHRDRMFVVTGDAAIESDIERLFLDAEKQFGRCVILVNNAGMIDPAPIAEITSERWDRMFAVNVRSAFIASRLALTSMTASGGGVIVNVASISGVVGPEKFPGFASYNASKAALISLTEALAVEVKDRGVRVNCVSPGSVDTKMWAASSGGAPAAMTADEVAETILFLASDRSRPMNGQNLHVYNA